MLKTSSRGEPGRQKADIKYERGRTVYRILSLHHSWGKDSVSRATMTQAQCELTDVGYQKQQIISFPQNCQVPTSVFAIFLSTTCHKGQGNGDRVATFEEITYILRDRPLMVENSQDRYFMRAHKGDRMGENRVCISLFENCMSTFTRDWYSTHW